MKIEKKLNRIVRSIAHYDVNPTLPSVNASSEDQELSGPNSDNNNDDDSTWYNESAI